MIEYLRNRHEPLDYLRIDNPGFNQSWNLFFGTSAPGNNPRVIATERWQTTSPKRVSPVLQRKPAP